MRSGLYPLDCNLAALEHVLLQGPPLYGAERSCEGGMLKGRVSSESLVPAPLSTFTHGDTVGSSMPVAMAPYRFDPGAVLAASREGDGIARPALNNRGEANTVPSTFRHWGAESG